MSVTCANADKRTSSPGSAEDEAQAERVLLNDLKPPDNTSLAVVQSTYNTMEDKLTLMEYWILFSNVRTAMIGLRQVKRRTGRSCVSRTMLFAAIRQRFLDVELCPTKRRCN